jgi:hypothetical protein
MYLDLVRTHPSSLSNLARCLKFASTLVMAALSAFGWGNFNFACLRAITLQD